MAGLNDELARAIAELEDTKVLELVKERIAAGVAPLEIVGSLQEGMVEVGNRFEAGEYFLSELILCGEIMKDSMTELEPLLAGVNQEHKGNIVIGTVRGDVHDLGKNIVVMLLKGAGYNVIDLGVDVPIEKVVSAVKEYDAPMLGLSALLTGCQDAMKETIDAVRKEGLNVTVVVGGNYVDNAVKEYVGADYFGTSASDAVKIAEKVFAGH